LDFNYYKNEKNTIYISFKCTYLLGQL
jgi:hypothetical protein